MIFCVDGTRHIRTQPGTRTFLFRSPVIILINNTKVCVLITAICTDNDEEFERRLLHTDSRCVSKEFCLRRFDSRFDTVVEFLHIQSRDEQRIITYDIC